MTAAAAENRQVAHTPGPWTVHELEDQGKFSIVHWGPLAYVGDVGGHDGMATARANARLIAAAPDLLAALRETESQLRAYQDAADDWFGTGGDLPESFRSRNVCANAAIDRARAAIARAE
jgi:hypothetical protein